MKRILALAAGRVHPPPAGRAALKRLLSSVPGIEVTWTKRVEDLLRLEREDFDTCLLYLHRQEISDRALNAFRKFVVSGGGLLALHSATACFKNRPEFFEVLGGRFTGHGPVGKFTAEPVGRGPLRDPGAFTIVDELYHHDTAEDADILYAVEEGGAVHPAAWIRTYGRGRVFYLVAGHRAGSLRNPVIRSLITAAADWVCRGEDHGS